MRQVQKQQLKLTTVQIVGLSILAITLLVLGVMAIINVGSTTATMASGTSTIGDFVWHDVNGNGIQEPNEPGISNLKVELFDMGGNAIGMTRTTNQGYFDFSGLEQGIYQLKFDLPLGKIPTNFQSTSSEFDSDIDSLGYTPYIILANGVQKIDVDAGFVNFVPGGAYQVILNNSIIGNMVFSDINHNGIQDSGDSPLGDVHVQLLDGLGNVLYDVLSDENGVYEFTNVPAMAYTLRVIPVTGFEPTIANIGSDETDSDLMPNWTVANVIINSNTPQIQNVDIGLSPIFTALPIELVEFKAIIAQQEVKLEWKTANEVNNNYFEVERAASQREAITVIGKVKGAINSKIIQKYSLTDYQPLVGKAYYRLKQTDLNGNFTYSKWTLVEKGNEAQYLTVKTYPNPAINKVNMEINTLVADNIAYALVDMAGHVVLNGSIEASNNATLESLDVSNMANGIYVLRVTQGQEMQQHKIVVRH